MLLYAYIPGIIGSIAGNEIHSAGDFIRLAAGSDIIPVTNAAAKLDRMIWYPAKFIRMYLVICPAAAIPAQKG